MQEKIQNISPLKKKILQYIDSLDISKRNFYSKTGISRGTLESKTDITQKTLAKFFDAYPEIDRNEFMKIQIKDDIPKINEVNEPIITYRLCKNCEKLEIEIDKLRIELKGLQALLTEKDKRILDLKLKASIQDNDIENRKIS